MPDPGAPVDLRAFLDRLRSEGLLLEIDCEVDPNLEIAEIHRRVIANSGPALLFRNVKGSPWPVVTNLFGTPRRVELAFGNAPEALIERIVQLPEKLMPPSLGRAWQERGTLGKLLKIGMKRRRSGPVTAVVDDPPGLNRLPLLKTWAEDGGAFITLPLVLTEHPDGLGSNLGMYRSQRFDDRRMGLHTQIGKGGGFHLAAYAEKGLPMPVNIHIGGPPALILAAIAPLPENVPELLLASLMLGNKLEMCANPLGPVPVAARSEFVLVGEVAPGAMHPEGPFGDHYGYYSLKHDYPLIEVKGLLRRPDPILAATVVGKPRQEDFFIGDYLQRLLSPCIKLVMPAVKDLWSYGETGFHSLAAAVVAQRYKREAMASAFRILGEGQLALTKFLLLTDQPVDLRNFPRTLEHVLARAEFETDLYVFGNLSMDSLDYCGPKINEGSKGLLMGLGDERRKLPREFKGALPSGVTAAVPYCGGCLVLEAAEDAVDHPARLARESAFADWPLLVLVDSAKTCVASDMSFLWTTFTRFEPAADIHASGQEIRRNQALWKPPILIDARMKPGYPDELACDAQTSDLVDRRWDQYHIPDCG